MVFLYSKLAVSMMATCMFAAAATTKGYENGTDTEGCIGKGQNAL